MKTIILSLIILTSSHVWAADADAQLIPQQEAQLLKLLQQMEPEIVEELLSDAGVQWYTENTNNFDSNTLPQGKNDTYGQLTQPINLGINEYQDENAPKFN